MRAALAGRSSALSDEHGYAMRTLPSAVGQAPGEAVSHARSGARPAIAAMIGFPATTGGSLAGRLILRKNPADLESLIQITNSWGWQHIIIGRLIG